MITGSPGVGKHAVAAVMARDFGLDLLDANDVATKAGLVDEKGGVDTAKLGREMADAGHNNNALMVGHLAPYALEPDQVNAAIVLRKSPYTLEGIYKKRRYTRAKSLANLGAEILGIVAYDTISKFGRTVTCQIDNTSRSLEETAALAHLACSADYPGDNVDWLEKVRKSGDMQRFFAY